MVMHRFLYTTAGPLSGHTGMEVVKAAPTTMLNEAEIIFVDDTAINVTLGRSRLLKCNRESGFDRPWRATESGLDCTPRIRDLPAVRPSGSERRLHVRVRPTADYDVTVRTTADGIVWFPLQVVDVSVGGLGLLMAEELAGRELGDSLKLRIEFPGGTVADVTAVIRHRARGICGVAFAPLPLDVQTRVQEAVAQLLERGSVA